MKVLRNLRINFEAIYEKKQRKNSDRKTNGHIRVVFEKLRMAEKLQH